MTAGSHPESVDAGFEVMQGELVLTAAVHDCAGSVPGAN
jgi:hypothetical protein